MLPKRRFHLSLQTLPIMSSTILDQLRLKMLTFLASKLVMITKTLVEKEEVEAAEEAVVVSEATIEETSVEIETTTEVEETIEEVEERNSTSMKMLSPLCEDQPLKT